VNASHQDTWQEGVPNLSLSYEQSLQLERGNVGEYGAQPQTSSDAWPGFLGNYRRDAHGNCLPLSATQNHRSLDMSSPMSVFSPMSSVDARKKHSFLIPTASDLYSSASPNCEGYLSEDMGGDFMVNSPAQPNTRAFETAEPVYMSGGIGTQKPDALMETESHSAFTYQPTTDTISVEYVSDHL
jgi:hypothetical protein